MEFLSENTQMIKVKLDLDDEQFKRNLNNIGDRVDRAITQVVDYNAAYAEEWMKQNAPWTDRTGAARSGLTAIANHQSDTWEIFMAYSVYYGIWLEIANSGKYQIMIPAMRHVGQKILEDLKRVVYRS